MEKPSAPREAELSGLTTRNRLSGPSGDNVPGLIPAVRKSRCSPV